MKKPVFRVIDANFNRAREGLRVCEEFARFFSNDRRLTREFKKLRNDIRKIYSGVSVNKKELLAARDTGGDTGRIGFAFEKKRKVPEDVFWASMQRTKESLRVLEEFAKLINGRSSDRFKAIRFEIYELEKRAYKKLKKIL